MRDRGWGFAIDYDRALAEDEVAIAWAERSIQRGWYRRSRLSRDGSFEIEHMQLLDLILYHRDVAATAGYSPQDVADLSAYCEVDVWELYPDLPAEQPGRPGHERGRQLLAEIEALSGGWLYRDEAAARAGLRRARASRARHLRNRDKYGRTRGARP